MTLTHLKDVSTLELDKEACNGCRTCLLVCPQNVFTFANKKAHIEVLDQCMECSACAMNCESGALTVRRGVGCAAAIITTALGITGDGGC